MSAASGPPPAERDAAPSALPRPGMNPVNRLAMAITRRRSPRKVERSDLDRWVRDSVATMLDLGADRAALDRVHSDSASWVIDSGPAPEEVWCGEILWSDTAGERPKTHIYPDSPWGRTPGRVFFELGAQTGIDHMVSHLYRYEKGSDFSEEAACTDQVRLMFARGGLRARVAGVAICLGLRLHKEIPLHEFRARLATPVPS